MSNTKEFKNIIHFSVSTWINFAVGFLSTFILTRVFVPEVLGTINLFYSTVATLMSVVCLGLDSGFIRFFNEPPDNERSSLFLIKLILICISFLIILAGISYIIFTNDITEFFLGRREFSLYICVIIGVINQIFLRFLNISYRMRMDIRNYNIQSVLTNIVTRLSVIIGALIDSNSANYAIYCNVLCISTLLIFYLYYQRKEWIPGKINFCYKHYGEIFKFSLYIVLAGIIINAYTLSSQLIIKYFLGAYSVGIYTSAALFITILSVVKGGFGAYWSAFMYANYDKPDKRAYIMQVHRVVMLLSIIFICFLFSFRRVLYLFIGSDFHESMTFFSLVIMYPLFQTIQETTGYGIMLKKKTHITTIISLFSFVINIGLGILLVQKWGIVGMAWANIVSAIFTYILTTLIGQKYFKSIPNSAETFVISVFIILLSIITMYITNDLYLIFICLFCVISASIIYRDLMIKGLIILKNIIK